MRRLIVVLLVVAGAWAHDIDSLIEQGNRLQRARQFDDAERVYRSALPQTSATARGRILNNIAALYYERGQSTQAKELYSREY